MAEIADLLLEFSMASLQIIVAQNVIKNIEYVLGA